MAVAVEEEVTEVAVEVVRKASVSLVDAPPQPWRRDGREEKRENGGNTRSVTAFSCILLGY